MRLTTDEILERFPSMWMSGKPEHYATVQGRYYGDLPYKVCPVEPQFGNIDAVDAWIGMVYHPNKVNKYNFNHGQVYIRDDGKVICGDITINYGNSYGGYTLTVFNGHSGITGFKLWVGDTGKVTVRSYLKGISDSYLERITREELSSETINKVFNYVLKNDDYGMAAKELVKTAMQIYEEE